MADAPKPVVELSDAVLLEMADDAFVVLNWARRQGFRKDKQLDEVVNAYRKTLRIAKAEIAPSEPEIR